MTSKASPGSVIAALCLVGWFWLAIQPAASAPALPGPIEQVMTWQRLDPAQVSIWVQRVGDQEPLLDHLGDKPRNPASVMKLFVTLAALDGLGPAYRWTTDVHATGLNADGSVGELWLRGTGDPPLLAEDIWQLAGAIRRSGVRRIDGRLMLDASHFALEDEDPGAFDNAPTRVYNQPPHALLVDFNAVRFHMRADRQRGVVHVEAEPPLPSITVDNRVRLEDRPCGGFQRGVSVNPVGNGAVRLEGGYPARCDDAFRLVRRVLEPEQYLADLFSVVWSQWGGEHAGDWAKGVWPDEAAEPLFRHQSRPLGDVIRLVNKYSSNVMTRQLALTLGAEVFGPPATEDKARVAVLDSLTAQGVDTDGMVLDNAAGLSRTNRVSARQVAQVLEAGRATPFTAEFVSSLAISGLDGTARRRFANASETGRMHLKTGRLADVSTIAGYVRARDGADYMVAVLVNAPDAHLGPGEAVQDAVLRWVYER